MNVKELKEILKELPEEATVIVSEKFGRGYTIQSYIKGRLSKDRSKVIGVCDETINFYKQRLVETNIIAEAVHKGDYYWEKAKDEDDTDKLYRKSDNEFLMQTWSGESDGWTQLKILNYCFRIRKEDEKQLKRLQKQQEKQEINAIELSCNF